VICDRVCRCWQFDDKVHRYFVLRLMRRFAEFEVPILRMSYSLVLVTAVASLNVLRDLASHVGEHEVSLYVFCCLSNSRVAKRWSVVVVSNAVVLLIRRHLKLPVFD